MVMAAPVKYSSLDTNPNFLLRECIDVILPYLTAMVNTSLRCGSLPEDDSCDSYRRRLLWSHMNLNCRFNLSFESKLVERVAVKQLSDNLETNVLLPLLQSAYRSHHSTKTALLKVLSDVLTAINDKKLPYWPCWT